MRSTCALGGGRDERDDRRRARHRDVGSRSLRRARTARCGGSAQTQPPNLARPIEQHQQRYRPWRPRLCFSGDADGPPLVRSRGSAGDVPAPNLDCERSAQSTQSECHSSPRSTLTLAVCPSTRLPNANDGVPPTLAFAGIMAAASKASAPRECTQQGLRAQQWKPRDEERPVAR